MFNLGNLSPSCRAVRASRFPMGSTGTDMTGGLLSNDIRPMTCGEKRERERVACPRAKGRRRGRKGVAGGDDDRGREAMPAASFLATVSRLPPSNRMRQTLMGGYPGRTGSRRKGEKNKRGRGERKERKKNKGRCSPSKAVQGACLAGSEAFPTLRLHRRPLGINILVGENNEGEAHTVQTDIKK